MQLRIAMIGLVFLACSSPQAEIYRSQDQHGNTLFSDRPAERAEKIELNSAPYRYKVEMQRVIDGDTLKLESGEKVRLIGINTPEVENRFSEAQPGGEAAKTWLKKTLRSPYIWLEYDAEQFDKYDRRLAHVFTESGDYINAMLLKEGFAMLTLTPPNLRYATKLIAAQQQAETQQKGVWRMSAYQLKTLNDFQPGSSYRGWQRWLLTPRSLDEGRKYMHLVVSEHLMIHISKAQMGLFPPLKQYLGQPLEVRGWMRRRGSQHHILVQHPSSMMTH